MYHEHHFNTSIRRSVVKALSAAGKNVTGKRNEVIKNMTCASVFSALGDVGVAVLCQNEGGLTEAVQDNNCTRILASCEERCFS